MPSTSERIRLRTVTPGDAAAMFAYRSLPEVNTYTYTPVWTSLSDAEQHIGNLLEKISDPEAGTGKWMVERVDTGEVIGDVGLWKHDETQGTYEIGYMIHPAHAGHGFATEAVRAAMRIGFEEWGVHRIYARIDEENVGSVRICQKLGMRQEARLIENDRRGDVWSTELNFAMLDREWAAGRE